MSALSEAFEETLDAAEEVKGTREVVTFRGEEIDALIGESIEDLSPVSGGTADTSPTKVSLRLSDVELPFAELEEITIRGVTMNILWHAALEGRIDIVAGNPAADVD